MDHEQLLSLMDSLDKATNATGGLKPEIRARLWAVIENPTQETWDDAYGIMVSESKFITLWQALVRYGRYRVITKPSDGPWPEIPTQEQIVTALQWATRRVPRPGER